MAISQKVGGMLEKASWIRKMFEEGSRPPTLSLARAQSAPSPQGPREICFGCL